MRRILWLVIFLWCSSCMANPQPQFDAESKVLALERLWGEASQMRDVKALESLFDDSIAYVDVGGRLMTKTEILVDTKNSSPVNIVVEGNSAHSYGNAVIVTGILHLSGVDKGKAYLRHGRFLDTWIYRGNRWACISSMTTAIRR